jgi:GTP-binding protein
MLHLIDLLPPDDSNIADNVRVINEELRQFSQELADKEQWLVFNKADTLPEDERDLLVQETLSALHWQGRHFVISAVTGFGCPVLCREAMIWVEEHAPLPEVIDTFAPEAPAEAVVEVIEPTQPAPHEQGWLDSES